MTAMLHDADGFARASFKDLFARVVEVEDEIDQEAEDLLQNLPQGFAFTVKERIGGRTGQLRRNGQVIKTYERWTGYEIWTQAWLINNRG